MDIIKVLLVDDHQIILDGVKNMLQNEPNISICGAYISGKEALDVAMLTKPDIIITDIMMPDMSGLEFVKLVKSHNLHSKILILSMFLSVDYIQNAVQAGANGFLMKQNATRDELMTAITSLIQGKNYFNTEVANAIVSGLVPDNLEKIQGAESHDLGSLSKRELEVLELFANGFSNSEISEKLFISVRTVETHKSNMIIKLGLKSYVDLIKIAIKNKLSEI